MKNLLRAIFLISEIISQSGELHFQRWRLLATPWFSIFIHCIYKADEDKHLHSHPWNFLSLILWGGYKTIEVDEADIILQTSRKNEYKAFSLNYNKAENFHKIYELNKSPTVSLVLAGSRSMTWGYFVKGKFIENQQYRVLKRRNLL